MASGVVVCSQTWVLCGWPKGIVHFLGGFGLPATGLLSGCGERRCGIRETGGASGWKAGLPRAENRCWTSERARKALGSGIEMLLGKSSLM
eukprot:936727-Amorphochlora_amoeboformis.AAC.1